MLTLPLIKNFFETFVVIEENKIEKRFEKEKIASLNRYITTTIISKKVAVKPTSLLVWPPILTAVSQQNESGRYTNKKNCAIMEILTLFTSVAIKSRHFY